MLYKPAQSEINKVISHVRSLHGDLGGRIDKAAQILSVGLDEINGAWSVDSQSEVKSYAVATSPRSCECADFQAGRCRIKGYAYCKHLLATHAYVRILRGHMQERTAGADGNALKQAKRYANTYLVRIANTDKLISTNRGGISIATRYSSEGVTFATDAGAIKFAHWLTQAAPLPSHINSFTAFVSLPSHSSSVPVVTPSSSETEWTRTDWQSWWDTGETPAMRKYA